MQDNSIIILSTRACRKKHHVSYDTILGMENAFIKEGAVLKLFSYDIGIINKILWKGHLKTRILDSKVCKDLSDRNILFIAMGIDDLILYKKELQKLAKCNGVGLYCFDVWESKYELYEEMYNYISPQLIFFAYKAACIHFSNSYRCYFVPQSMDINFFYPRNIEKTRLFIQIGRRNENIHSMILKYMQDKNIPLTDDNYLYEKVKGTILFPNTEDLATEIARTKYFVAAPQSKENTELTGRVSDVTARFYEAMACKTLIIGYKPDTFDELFPSDAMIDLENDETLNDVIRFFEEHPEEYQRIVDRNYDLIVKKHTWKERYYAIQKEFALLKNKI